MTDQPAASTVQLSLDAGVATVTLARPQAMNALDIVTKEALLQALREVADDSAVRCVVLTGQGRAFSVGQDLREHASLLRQAPHEAWRTVREHYNPIVELVAGMDKPVVAAVNGVAAGAGASLAFAADLRYLADTAGFTLAFAGVALSCDSGASWTLPRLVGTAKAKELMMLGGSIDAATALRLGLATEVLPSAGLPARVAEVSRALRSDRSAARSPSRPPRRWRPRWSMRPS
jgi:2-(1,2-epoxy-1,2-dihydrophenyl)acetyl-CoA isomerase